MAGNFGRKLRLPRIHFRVVLHAANMRHGTNGFTSLPKEGVLSFFFALKNPTASAGFEPANLGTKCQHATSRPPKLKLKLKSKLVPIKTNVWVAAGVKLFLKSVLDGKEWSASCTGCFTHWKIAPAPTDHKTGWSPEQLWTVRIRDSNHDSSDMQPLA